MTQTAATAVPRELIDGYTSRTILVDGVEMTFTFYMGFASKVTYTPQGGREQLVYQQEGVFKVPGGVLPDAVSTISIQGGPDGLDVEVEIDDAPISDRTGNGPVGKVDIRTKKNAKDPKPKDKRVKVLKGEDQVQAVDVTLTVDLGGGGVFAYQTDPGGTTTATNQAATCPPHC